MRLFTKGGLRIMKRKGNLSSKRRNLAVLLVAFVLVISSVLTACGTSTATTTPETKQEVAAVDKEEVQVEVEETTQEEVVQETTEDVQGPQTVSQWAKTFDAEEPQLTIWNDITKEGIILENEQKYSLKEGDLLVVCTKEKENGIRIQSDITFEDFTSIASDRYIKFEFSKEILEETLFELYVTVAGVEYPFSVTLISENATATISESETTEVSGKDWANSLEYDEPKLVAWNDETGTKEVIEQGGKYVMQQGDILGVYYPTGYFVVTALPYDFFQGFTVLSKVCIMDCKLPSESQDINLEVEVLNEKSESGTYNFIITTP